MDLEVFNMPADFTSLGRFSAPALYILSSLASGDKHGYAMVQDIIAFSGVRLEPGTLYGALARLERWGWIEPLPARDRRHPYRLTSAGRTALAAQVEHLQQVTAISLGRLTARGEGL
jgi:DNA-binding PadR family transcriptional regulator